MLLAAVLIDALKAALEDGEKAFDRVGGGFVADILAGGMVNRVMAGKLAAQLRIKVALVRHQHALTADILADDRSDVIDRGAVHVEAAGLAIALYQGHDSALVVVAAASLRHSILAPDVGFVGLYNLARAAHGGAANVPERIASRMRCVINQAVL